MTIEDQERNQIEISGALPSDAIGILEVQKKTWIATYPNEEYGITLEDIESKDWSAPGRVERWRKTIEEGGQEKRMWVAKAGEKVIGFCLATREQAQNRLAAIYVLPEYQKKGVGGNLVERAFGWLGGEKDIAVAVAKYNSGAIDFYKKVGFQGEREIPDSVQLPSGKFIPEIELVKPRALIP